MESDIILSKAIEPSFYQEIWNGLSKESRKIYMILCGKKIKRRNIALLISVFLYIFLIAISFDHARSGFEGLIIGTGVTLLGGFYFVGIKEYLDSSIISRIKNKIHFSNLK